MSKSQLKAAVLAGGVGDEREVSIQSGACVRGALEEAGYEVVLSDITPDDMSILEDGSVDVFFIALHGRFGEDGQLQKVLDERQLTYTGSGAEASRIAFDKIECKKVLQRTGLATPEWVEFAAMTEVGQVRRRLSKIGGRFVVKPVRGGSSVGTKIAGGVDEAVELAETCLKEFGDCMIEEYIRGREITAGVLCGKELPLIEIRTRTGFYDYHAKYMDEQTKYLFDTISDAKEVAKIQAQALRCFEAVGCRHFGRVDFIISEGGVPYVLEINTIPGFTTHSLLPMAAGKAGLSMSGLCAKIVEAAVKESKVNSAAG